MNEEEPQHCPRAKLLAGTWHCPCHGMEDEPRVPKTPKVRPKPPQRLPKPRKRKEPVALDPDEVRRLHGDGWSIVKLRRRYACGSWPINDILGLPQPKALLTVAEKAEIQQAVDIGESISSIARRYQRERWAIYGALGRPRTQASIRPECPSTLDVAGERFICHLKTHTVGTHRCNWSPQHGTTFRVEWR